MIIINRSGHIEISNEIVKFKDGDIIYMPQETSHSLPNDVNEMVEFLTFGGFTGMKKGVGGG
jgi:mannose-6-phosphate isomerase-like protein (cupin superfamily)